MPAAAEPEPRTDQVRIVYEEPIDAKHLPIREAMQERRILETVAELLNAFRLPRELTLEVKGCNGRERPGTRTTRRRSATSMSS